MSQESVIKAFRKKKNKWITISDIAKMVGIGQSSVSNSLRKILDKQAYFGKSYLKGKIVRKIVLEPIKVTFPLRDKVYYQVKKSHYFKFIPDRRYK